MPPLDAWISERYFFGGYFSQDSFTMSSNLPAILVAAFFLRWQWRARPANPCSGLAGRAPECPLQTDSHDPRAQPVPSRRIGLEFHLPRRSERVHDVQIGSTGRFCKTSGRQIACDVALDLFLHQIAIQSGIPAVQLTVPNCESLVRREIGVPIEFERHFLRQRSARGKQVEDKHSDDLRLSHTGGPPEDFPFRDRSVSRRRARLADGRCVAKNNCRASAAADRGPTKATTGAQRRMKK
jgi:hypothetical protein